MTTDSDSTAATNTHPVSAWRRHAPKHVGHGAVVLADVKRHAAGATHPRMSAARERAMQFGHIGCRE